MGVKRSMPKTARGFTLIEIMIVAAIIGVLAGIAIPKFAQLIRKSQEAATLGQLGGVRGALTIYYADNEGRFPQVPLGFNTTVLQGVLTAQAKYLAEWPSLHVPTYHDTTNTVDTVTSDDFAAIDPVCDGEYVYVANPASPAFGKIAIECYNQDLRGRIWSTY